MKVLYEILAKMYRLVKGENLSSIYVQSGADILQIQFQETAVPVEVGELVVEVEPEQGGDEEE